LSFSPNPSARPQANLGGLDYKWTLLLVVSGGGFLAIMDGGMVAIGVPAMIAGLDTNSSLIVWISLAYFMGSTVPLLPFARVADAFGRKRMYLWGVLIVAAGLSFSAVSQDVTQLIAARVATAIGSSMILANDNALLTQAFPASERGKAQGFINMAFGLGLGVGFLLGGVLVDFLGWRALFWSRIPAQLVLALLVWRLIRDDPTGSSGSIDGYRIDHAGVVLLTAVMVSGLLAINQAGKLGFSSPFVVAALVVAALALPILLIVERRAAFPIIQLKLFTSREFSSGVGAQFFAQIAHGGWNFLAPFLLITGIGHSASFAGLMILPFHVIRLVLSPVSGAMSDRFGTQLPSLIGHLALLGGLLALTRLGPDASIWQQMVVIAIGGAGLSIFLPANNSAIMGSVPQDSLSSASGFLAASRAIGTSVGVALAAAIYSGNIGPRAAIVSGEVSPLVVSAVGEGITLVCAVSAIGILAIALRGRG
jgi:EmrB/QacA subfamily drug resistance transporter